MVVGTPHQLVSDGAIPTGAVLFDVAATSLAAIAHVLIDQMIYEGQIKTQDREDILRTLLLQHKYARCSRPQGDPIIWAGSSPSEHCWNLAWGGKAPPCFGFTSQLRLGVPTYPQGWDCLTGVWGGQWLWPV